MDAPAYKQTDLVMLAAAYLEKGGKRPFTIEDLTVRAWLNNKEVFGLKGYKLKYPHSAKVISIVVGRLGITNRGLLEKTAPSTYQMTRDGKNYVALLKGEEVIATRQAQAGPVISFEMERLLKSVAVTKFNSGRRDEVSFQDACVFWGLPAHIDLRTATCGKIDERIGLVVAPIMRLGADLADGHTMLLDSGRVITEGDLRALLNIHDWMNERFQRHLNILRARKSRAS